MVSFYRIPPTLIVVVLGDGRVVTWGHRDFGGDSAAVRDQLRDVLAIQAQTPTCKAAGILGIILGEWKIKWKLL